MMKHRNYLSTSKDTSRKGQPVKLTAFTLAETLITLGIIGVVAAMTIPNLMAKYYEHQTVSRLLETQSIISQAFRTAEEDLGEVSGWGITKQNEYSANIVGNNIKQFLKLALDCGTRDEKSECFPDYAYTMLNGKSNGGAYSSDFKRYKISLLNGSSVSFIVIYGSNDIQINIDTNGPSKPNTIGKDLFMFQYDTDDKSLVAMGAPSSLYPMDKFCTKNSSGFGCAYYILQNRNMDYLK